MPLPKLPVTWNWSGVKTDTSDRSLQPGELTSLVNVRRTVEGRLQKRLGLDRTVVHKTNGDVLAGPASDVVPSDVLIVRDPDDQIYAVDAEDVAHDRGADPRAHPTWVQVQNLDGQGGTQKPLVVHAGGRVYHLVLVVTSDFKIQVTVYDTDAVLLASPTLISATDIVAVSATADANGAVWVAFVKADTGIYIRKLSTTGAVTTSATITVGATEFQDVKLRLMPNGSVLLAAISVDTGGTNLTVKRYHAYLNTSTGAAQGSPAPVTATVTTGPLSPNIACGPGLSIANSADDTSLYFLHFWAADTSTSLLLKRVQVNPTTFAEAESTIRTVTVGAAVDEVWIGATAAFHLAGVVTAFSSLGRVDTSSGPIETRTSLVVKSASGVDTTVARSAYLAGDDVFKVGTVRYILTGFDDMSDEDNPGTQRGYFIRDTSGRIVTTVLDGVAGQVFFNGGLLAYDPSMGHTVSPAVSGTTVFLPLLTVGDTKSLHDPVLATVDFDPAWDSKATNIVPGGVPKFVSKEDNRTELAPIHYPYVDPFITSDGSGADFSRNRLTYRYVTLDGGGNRVPSSPRPTVVLQAHEYMSSADDDIYFYRVATLRHAVGDVWIEVFLSDDQDSGHHPTAGTELYLARRFPNSTTADYVDVPLRPKTFVAGSGELLDTTNLEARLENGSLPPARLAAIARKRLFLAGTPEDDIIYSQEKRDGHGYEFNEALSIVWSDGTGPVRAICPLSFDVPIAAFRQDAIGLVTGAGPAPNGAPNFDIATVSYTKGTTNPKSVVLGPAGIYFLAQDGRPNLLTTGGAIVEIGKGYESYVGTEVTAAIHDEAQGFIVYSLADGKRIVLDYRHPLPNDKGEGSSQPAGQWYEHSNTNLPAMAGAVSVGGVAAFVEAGDEVAFWGAGTSFDDDGTAVLKDMVSGRMAPPGPLQEFDVDEVTLSSTRLGGDSVYRYTVTGDDGTPEVHPDAANATADVNFRSAVSRTREFRLRIQEMSATGEGRSFDGVSAVIRPRGRLQNPYRRIA